MSISNNFLIVGKSFNGIERAIEQRGDSFTVFNPANFAGKAALDEAINGLRGKVDGVVCIYENFVVDAAYIASKLGVPGMPLAVAKRCTDKFLMRRAFAKAPAPISAEYALVKDRESLLEFAKKNGYPLILKPANLTKSLLVSKNHNRRELLANYQKTLELLEPVYSKHAPGRQPKLLVEEFLEGPAYSVDAFVGRDGSPNVLNEIVDYQTGYDIGYDDNFHYSRRLPTRLNARHQAAVRRTAELGVKALGMRSSPAHIEIIYTKKGPRIIEIGARNGGYRERMHRLANGLKIYDIALDLALGRTPNIKSCRNEPCAVLELFPKKPGKFSGVTKMAELEKLPSLVSVALKHKIGIHVGKSSDGYKMCAIIVLHNKDTEQFNKDLDFINKNVRVKTV